MNEALGVVPPACPCCTCRHGRGREGCGACWTRDDVQRWIDGWAHMKSTLHDPQGLQVHRASFLCPPKGHPPCPGWEAKAKKKAKADRQPT